jgi:hypothetical protein
MKAGPACPAMLQKWFAVSMATAVSMPMPPARHAIRRAREGSPAPWTEDSYHTAQQAQPSAPQKLFRSEMGNFADHAAA